MNKTVIGIALLTCAAVCVGYFVHRKRKMDKELKVLESLKLKDIFDWVDSVFNNIEKGEGERFEINVLPNPESQKLAKQNDKRIYVAVLKKEKDGVENVVATKTFYAQAVDVDLESLNHGNIVVIPIE